MKAQATRWDRFTAQPDSTGDCTIAVTGYVWWKLRWLSASFQPNSSNGAAQVTVQLNNGDVIFISGQRLKSVGGQSNQATWAIGLSESSTEIITVAGAKTGTAEDATAMTSGLPDVEMSQDGKIVLSGALATGGIFAEINYVIEGTRIGDPPADS